MSDGLESPVKMMEGSLNQVSGAAEADEASILVTEDISPGEWDEFVRSHPEPHHEQMTLWDGVKRHAGWSASRLGLKLNGRLVGCAQMLELKVKGVLKIGYLSRGPLVAEDRFNARMVQELRGFSRRKGYVYVAVSLPYHSTAIVEDFKRQGFLPRPLQLPPEVWVRANLLINLRKPVDELLMDLRCSTRREVRKGIKAGVTVREGTEADFPLFCELVDELCERRGVSSNMPAARAVREFWDGLRPGNHMRLFVVEVGGKAVCALTVIFFGRWARAWRIGWNGEHKNAYPTKVLYWHVIQRCKELGYELFDWIGIDERDAREMMAGREREAAFHCPITAFKLGFGGDMMILPGEWCYFPNPVLRFGFKHLGSWLLSKQWIQGLARRMHSRSVRREN